MRNGDIKWLGLGIAAYFLFSRPIADLSVNDIGLLMIDLMKKCYVVRQLEHPHKWLHAWCKVAVKSEQDPWSDTYTFLHFFKIPCRQIFTNMLYLIFRLAL